MELNSDALILYLMKLIVPSSTATDRIYLNLQKDEQWLIKSRAHVEELYEVAKAYLDSDFREQFQHNFRSRYAEMYFVSAFVDAMELELGDHSDVGPDIFLSDLNAWAEVVTPTDGELGNPNTVPKMIAGETSNFSSDQIMLRLSGAFCEKAEKFRKYLSEEIVSPSQSLIICISGGGLADNLPLHAPGSYPGIVKTLFPIGDPTCRYNLQTGKFRDPYHKFRQGIEKVSGKETKIIDMDFFLRDEYRHISAVVYSWAKADNPPSRQKWGADFYTIHNPLAVNPLAHGSIGVGREYTAKLFESGFKIITLR